MKRLFSLIIILFCLTSLTACGSNDRANKDRDMDLNETVTDSSKLKTAATKDEYIPDPAYFSIMYATIIDINGKVGDSETVYSFREKDDERDAWSVTGLEIGDMEVSPAIGLDIVLLVSGDRENDSENVEFIAMLPEGSYNVKHESGVSINNVMSTFDIDTDDGRRISFNKDNCFVHKGLLTAESGDKITVYYAEGDEDNWPFGVYER